MQCGNNRNNNTKKKYVIFRLFVMDKQKKLLVRYENILSPVKCYVTESDNYKLFLLRKNGTVSNSFGPRGRRCGRRCVSKS